MRRRHVVLLLLLATTVPGASARADPAGEVARLLAAGGPPRGVVFEVVTGDDAALEEALPAVRAHARALRERFPGLPVAVLTHGSEQFSLLGANADRYDAVHALATGLGEEDRVAVQVCGNHASFRGKGRADFPDYVEVVDSASSKLGEYRAAGWAIILM